MNDKALELKKMAQKLSRKAIKYSKKIEETMSNKELVKLEELENKANEKWEEYFEEYYGSIGGKKPEFKEPDFPPQYDTDDYVEHSERVC